MPEVTPDKNLELHRQCEIRRPSPPGVLDLGDREIAKPAGYYFDVVWRLLDGQTEWIIAEVYGSKPMPSARIGFKPVPAGV